MEAESDQVADWLAALNKAMTQDALDVAVQSLPKRQVIESALRIAELKAEFLRSLLKMSSLKREDDALLKHADKRIAELDVPKRVLNSFATGDDEDRWMENRRILTVRDLVQHTPDDLLFRRNFGKDSLKRVRELLATMGITLKGDTRPAPARADLSAPAHAGSPRSTFAAPA